MRPLIIVEYLARYEKLEEELRSSPSAPGQDIADQGDRELAVHAWRLNYDRRHEALTSARGQIFDLVRAWMRALASPASGMYPMFHEDQEKARNELTFFNSWMSLRGAPRWGDPIYAPNLATSMLKGTES